MVQLSAEESAKITQQIEQKRQQENTLRSRDGQPSDMAATHSHDTPEPVTQAPSPGTAVMPETEDLWEKFEEQKILLSATGLSFEDLEKLEQMTEEEKKLLFVKFRDGETGARLAQYVRVMHGVQADTKSITRYWRRRLNGFTAIEEQRRETKKALQKLERGEL